MFTNNLENANETCWSVRWSTQIEITCLLVRQGHFTRSCLMVCKGLFLFFMGHYSSNLECSHTKIPLWLSLFVRDKACNWSLSLAAPFQLNLLPSLGNRTPPHWKPSDPLFQRRTFTWSIMFVSWMHLYLSLVMLPKCWVI